MYSKDVDLRFAKEYTCENSRLLPLTSPDAPDKALLLTTRLMKFTAFLIPQMRIFANFSKKIEVMANITIIVVASLLGVVLVKNFLLVRTPRPLAEVNPAVQKPNQDPPRNLSSLDMGWKQNGQTLVLAISSTCHFCTDSASFYKTLAQSKQATRLVAVLPQSPAEGRNYLQSLGVTVDEVRQLPLDKLGVRGTPTLLLVDDSGLVKNSWVGKLAPDKETEVIASLH